MKKPISSTLQHSNLFTEQVAANESASGVINSTPVAGARSHFRSRTFSSFFGCNPLTSAASALLNINEQLKDLPQHENLEQLQQDLVHEVKAFETAAQERGYSTETIIIARYTLCAALDETIIYSALTNSSLWQRFKLISTFQNEQSADERFFLLVERLLSIPVMHIDLLELIYICLSSGFQGKYRYEPHGYEKLVALKDRVFQQIRGIRQDPPKLIATETQPEQNSKPSSVSLYKVLIKTSITAALCLGLVYVSCAFVFNKVSSPVQQQVSQLVSTSSSLPSLQADVSPKG